MSIKKVVKSKKKVKKKTSQPNHTQASDFIKNIIDFTSKYKDLYTVISLNITYKDNLFNRIISESAVHEDFKF